MEKGNQPESGSGTAVQQQTPEGAGGAAAGGAPPPGGTPPPAGEGATPEPGTGTGTPPTGNPPPAAPGGGGGSQADQSGPKRNWEQLDSSRNPDGTRTTVDHDGEGALRYTTYDAAGNVVSQEIQENTNTGGQPPAEEPPTRTYETDGGSPPEGGPEPFSDVPPDPNAADYKSWRDMPAQEVEIPGGDRLSLDGEGGLKFNDGETTFRREGGNWVDEQTGERAPSDTAKRANGAVFDLEHGIDPINRRY